jgi:hypothetical protein
MIFPGSTQSLKVKNIFTREDICAQLLRNSDQLNSIQQNDTQHNGIQHNDTQLKQLFVTLTINYFQHNKTLYKVPLWSVSRFIYCYAECHYAEFCYAECRGACKTAARLRQ